MTRQTAENAATQGRQDALSKRPFPSPQELSDTWSDVQLQTIYGNSYFQALKNSSIDVFAIQGIDYTKPNQDDEDGTIWMSTAPDLANNALFLPMFASGDCISNKVGQVVNVDTVNSNHQTTLSPYSTQQSPQAVEEPSPTNNDASPVLDQATSQSINRKKRYPRSPADKAYQNGSKAALKGYEMKQGGKLIKSYPDPRLREIYVNAYLKKDKGEQIRIERRKAEKERLNKLNTTERTGYKAGRTEALTGRIIQTDMESLNKRFPNADDNYLKEYINGYESVNLSQEQKAEKRARKALKALNHTKTPLETAIDAAKRHARKGYDLPKVNHLLKKYPEAEVRKAYIKTFYQHELPQDKKHINHAKASEIKKRYKLKVKNRGKANSTYTPQKNTSSRSEAEQAAPSVRISKPSVS